MAADFLLEIEGLKGESSIKGGCIDITSFSMGAHNPGSFGTGSGGGAGKVNVSDFTVTKHLDTASTQLFIKCCDGEHLKKLSLSCRLQSKKQEEYCSIVLTDLIVSSYNLSGVETGTGQKPTESVSFNFGKIEYKYNKQSKEGVMEPGSPVTWLIPEVKAG